MFRKLVLALALAAVTTGSGWAQFGGDAVKGGNVSSKHPPNKIAWSGPVILGANGPKAPVKNFQGGVGNGKALNPANSQKGILSILIGLAKQPSGSAPAAKAAVPGPVPLKEQIEKRRQQLGVEVRKGLNSNLKNPK